MPRLPPLPPPLLNAEQIAGLVDAIGRPDLGGTVLAALGPALRCAHLSAFVFDAHLQAHQVMAESLGRDPALAERAGRMAQATGLLRVDPNTRAINAVGKGPKGESSGAQGEILTTRRRATDIAVDDQARELYARFQLADRVSLLARARDGWFALNLYRACADGEFDSATLTAWDGLARLLASLLRRHFEWQVPTAWRKVTKPDNAALERRLAGLPGALSLREQQVCARALRGITNPGIALDLGVQVSTVSTLRRRAFAKLGISTLGELFLMCLWSEGPPAPGA